MIDVMPDLSIFNRGAVQGGPENPMDPISPSSTNPPTVDEIEAKLAAALKSEAEINASLPALSSQPNIASQSPNMAQQYLTITDFNSQLLTQAQQTAAQNSAPVQAAKDEAERLKALYYAQSKLAADLELQASQSSTLVTIEQRLAAFRIEYMLRTQGPQTIGAQDYPINGWNSRVSAAVLSNADGYARAEYAKWSMGERQPPDLSPNLLAIQSPLKPAPTTAPLWPSNPPATIPALPTPKPAKIIPSTGGLKIPGMG